MSGARERADWMFLLAKEQVGCKDSNPIQNLILSELK
jgi:hypothetical protein